MNCPIWSYC